MISTHRTTIAARIGQGLAAAALITGLAIGSAASAAAEFDIDAYDACVAGWQGPPDKIKWYEEDCCVRNGGSYDWDDGVCWGPASGEAQNVPQPAGPTTAPPVLQNPPGQPSNPVIPPPRGPNSGTVG